MKRLAFILGILLVSIIVILESSNKYNSKVKYLPYEGYDDDVWFG